MAGSNGARAASIGDVWDSTVDAARGRAGVIAPVALVAFLVPGLLQSGLALFGESGSATVKIATGLIVLLTLVLAIWGQLTIIGIATDPATTRAEASAAAMRRFLPMLGLSFLLGVGFFVLLVPFIAAGAASGMDFAAMAQPGATPDLSGVSSGAILFAFFYLLAFAAFLIWFGTRIVLLAAVVLNERGGIGAIRRAIALTRGITWKLIGVLVLFTVVMLVGTFAVQAAVFLVIRLPLGEGGLPLASFIGAVAGGLVTTVFTALFCVFTARLYVARAGVPGRAAEEGMIRSA